MPNDDSWKEKNQLERGVFEAFTSKAKGLLRDIIDDAGIDVVQIEARTKEVDSFAEKLTRKEGRYSNPLVDMTDLAALRVITYYQEDVERVCALIEREFDIDLENSGDKFELLDPDRFGYMSVHYVASISRKRATLLEWKNFKSIRFEVQVRTALQHAWAAVNHKLEYNSASEAPEELRRRLYRLSALFELADEQFSQIRDASNAIERRYTNEVREGKFDIPLNILSLAAYMEHHPYAKELRQVARVEELSVREPGADDYDGDTANALRPKVLALLEHFNVTTLSELDGVLREKIPSVFRRAPSAINPEAAHYLEAVIALCLSIAYGLERDVFNNFFPVSTWDTYQQWRELYLENEDVDNLPMKRGAS